MGMLYFIGIIFALIGFYVQSRLRHKINRYAQTTFDGSLSGKEVAEKMLLHFGIRDVRVLSVNGKLTDHYDPGQRTVNLSSDVYHGRNTMATAIAAHECGHAVQHAKSYPLLGFRSAIVPLVNIAGTFLPWLLMLGVMLIQTVPGLLIIAILAQAVITLFVFITLPVEFDASRRALKWLESENILLAVDLDAAKDALKWAAMTYVVAALAAAAQLLYLIFRYSKTGRR